MNKRISLLIIVAVLGTSCLVCSSEGPSASPDSMAASRDKQAAGMAKQHGSGGSQSADAASKAQGK